MERTLKTTRLSHVIGYLKWTNQEQKGNNQIALIKEEIKCRKRKGKQQRTDCTEWNRKHKQETQKWKKRKMERVTYVVVDQGRIFTPLGGWFAPR